MGELLIPTKIVDLGLLLLRLLGFAVSMLLTFCHRNPVRNDARGCAPSIARDARVFRFCKQPRDSVREAILARCGEPDLGELVRPPPPRPAT
jgi:hypothetical protein